MRELLYIDKNCPHCGSHFNAGRRNKKFCSSKCRSGHHNGKNREVNRVQAATNKQLLANYRILEGLLSRPGQNPSEVPYTVMIRRGFNLGIHTSRDEANEGAKQTIHWVYDLGWSRSVGASFFHLYRRGRDGRLILPSRL